MYRIFYMIVPFVVMLMSSCHSKDTSNPEEMAALTAKTYYEYLADGKCEAWVDGFYRPDSIPANYREQLVANARMYVGQIRETHKGLVSVGIAGAKVDTAQHVGHVFLVLAFADSVKEEIVVPMVSSGGNWYMR